MLGKILGSQQSLLLARHPHQQQGALELRVRFLQRAGDIEQQRAARAIVHGAVVDAIAIDRFANADMIDVRGQHNVFILELGIASGDPGHDVGRIDVSRVRRPSSRSRILSRGNAAAACGPCPVRRAPRRCVRVPCRSRSAWAGLKAIASLRTGGLVKFRDRPDPCWDGCGSAMIWPRVGRRMPGFGFE